MPPPVTSPEEPQSSAAVLMVRPAHFACNPQTAASNRFQTSFASPSAGSAESRPQFLALQEFDGLNGGLQKAGIEVIVAEDTASPRKPDAVFPNNWVSFHDDGTVVLYPMLARNRRAERREDIVRQVVRQGDYRVDRIVDLSVSETEGKFLEGTGSMVLDRVNRVAYAGRSPRTDVAVLEEFARRLGYGLVTFGAFDAASRAIYHTNVVMAIGAAFAVVCSEAITDAVERAAVLEKLRGTGHRVIEITLHQMTQFAANLLELAPPAGTLIALSGTAWRSFEAAQRRTLEGHGSLLIADIPVIERLGGGGVRCMLAAIHLPKRATPVTPVMP